MLIALDARNIYRPARRGTGKNLIDLYRHVAALRPEWRVLAYHREHDAQTDLLPAQVQPRRIEMPGDRVHAWENLRLPLAAWRERADLLHCPANTCPRWMPVDTVVSIHDLIPLDMPEGRRAEDVRRFARSIRRACRRASWIICPSCYTRERLVGEFDADARRITVNPWAADSSMRRVPRDEQADVVKRYGLRRPCVLHFGAAAPRKNTRRVLEAWARLPAPLRRDWRLLVVGLDGPVLDLMRDLTIDLNIAPSVALHGFAEEADLPALLSAAEILAFPSLSEGFGLPILDAWATDTAVLTSDVTSLPEVAGDAAELVDPRDASGISDGLARLMLDPCRRADLVERGRARLTRYDWTRTAQRFVYALEQAAGRRVRGGFRGVAELDA